jgi:hypothetical protein
MSDAEKRRLDKERGMFCSAIDLGTADTITDDPAHEAATAKLWAVYVSEAEKYDKGLVESWKSDMEGILIFVRGSDSVSLRI